MAESERRFHELLAEYLEQATRPNGAGLVEVVSVDVLAELIGVSRKTISAWISGRTLPKPASFAQLEMALFGSHPDHVKPKLNLHLAWERERRQGPRASNPAPVIPPQQPGPHFGIGPDFLLHQVPPSELDAEGNNIRRINDLLPLVRQAADALGARIGPDHNTFGDLGRVLAQYRAAIAPGNEPISWGYVWGLGVALEEMAAATARPVDRMQDALEDADQAALQTLRTLHGPLITATAEGRDLQSRADENRMTREEQAEHRKDAMSVAEALKDTADLAASKVLTQAAEGMGQGRHPERGTEFGLATIGNAAIVAIAAAAAFAGSAYLDAPTGMAQGAWEVTKQVPIVKAAINALSTDYQRILNAGGAQAEQLRHGLKLYWDAVRGVKAPMRRIAGRWANAFLDYIGEPRLGTVIDPDWSKILDIKKPDWADTISRDNCGVFVTIEVPALRGNTVMQRLRWIPPGTFLMGSPADDPNAETNEWPLHEVTIRRGFWLFDTPCTQELWTAVMGENPSSFNNPKRPVANVSWNDVQLFLSRLEPQFGLALPSEAQWEYACRAGTRDVLRLDDTAWYSKNSGNRTHDVAMKSPNAFGLYDMLGNVWEWCADTYHDTYDGAPDDGSMLSLADDGGAYRVIRGGSWLYLARNPRHAVRMGYAATAQNGDVGFRCARAQ